MTLKIEISRGEFGAVWCSKNPLLDLNADGAYRKSFTAFGWILEIKGSMLKFRRSESSRGPALADGVLMIDADGTVYLKTKRKRAQVHFASGNLDMRLWRRFGIDEVRFANPNRVYPEEFTASQSVPCRTRLIFSDGVPLCTRYGKEQEMIGGDQLSLFDLKGREVHDASWAVLNVAYALGTNAVRTYLILYALPPAECKSRLDQYLWIEQKLLTHIAENHLHYGFRQFPMEYSS